MARVVRSVARAASPTYLAFVGERSFLLDLFLDLLHFERSECAVASPASLVDNASNSLHTSRVEATADGFPILFAHVSAQHAQAS